MKQILLFLLLFLTLCSACKRVPTFSATNELDPQSKTFVPEKPQNVQLSVVDPNHMSISWSHESSNFEPEFIIERKTDNLGYQQIAVSKDSSYYLDNVKLIPGSTYSYRVKAATEFNEGEYGESSAFQFNLNPIANFEIVGINADSLLLTWENDNHFETEYQLGLIKLNPEQFVYTTVPKSTRSFFFTGLDTSFNYSVTISPMVHSEYSGLPNSYDITYKKDLFKIRDLFSLRYDQCCHMYTASYLDNGEKVVVGAQDGSIIILDSATGSKISTVTTDSEFQYYVKSFDDGQKFISATDKNITVRDINGNILYELNDAGGYISATLYEKDGQQYFVYSLQGQNKLTIYDLKKQTVVSVHYVSEENVNFDIDETGQFLLLSINSNIVVRSFPDFELLDDFQLISEPMKSIRAVSFLPNSTDLYYSRFGNSNPAIVREMFYDAGSGITGGDSYEILQSAYGLYPEPTGNYLIITGNNGSSSFRFFDLKEKEIKFSDSNLLGTTYDIEFHPQDPELVLRVLNQSIQEWTFQKNWHKN